MKLLIWDFDGTLAYLEGRWSGSLHQLLKTEEPALEVAVKVGIPDFLVRTKAETDVQSFSDLSKLTKIL
jgi:phosphoglycolate phosphatase-like HAD superfamily hydrolase